MSTEAQSQSQWHDLIATDELEEGWVTPASIGRRGFAVYQVAEQVYVTGARCSHAGANLCDGYFQGYLIECPLHQGCFDIRDGKAISAPAVRPIRCYTSRVKAGMVQILL